LTRERIQDSLMACGLSTGDQVFVHSSLKNIGWVDGGAAAVIEAFQDVLGETGLMGVPTLTHTFHREPDTEYLIWNKQTTPSRVGALTDTLWRLPGASRSDHPTHSVAAIGRGAAAFTANQPNARPTMAAGSP
jgi:aminoglycoside 3-N-acetyltransferase